MNLRSLSLAAAMLAALIAPAAAGPAEDAFLSKLAGAWTGKGTVSGAESGTIDCTMSFRQRSADVSFRGKCNITGLGSQNFSGTLAYNDKQKRYEATSPSGEITVGVKSGKSIVFTAKLKGLATGESIMKLSATRVVIDSTVKRSSAGAAIKSHVEMSR